jgi:hypothetical protein
MRSQSQILLAHISFERHSSSHAVPHSAAQLQNAHATTTEKARELHALITCPPWWRGWWDRSLARGEAAERSSSAGSAGENCACINKPNQTLIMALIFRLPIWALSRRWFQIPDSPFWFRWVDPRFRLSKKELMQKKLWMQQNALRQP